MEAPEIPMTLANCRINTMILEELEINIIIKNQRWRGSHNIHFNSTPWLL